MTPEKQLPTHDVLVASNPNKRNKDDKDHFRKVGAAWKNRDGKGYFIQLFALPLDGKLLMREPLEDKDEPHEERRYAEQSRGR